MYRVVTKVEKEKRNLKFVYIRGEEAAIVDLFCCKVGRGATVNDSCLFTFFFAGYYFSIFQIYSCKIILF